MVCMLRNSLCQSPARVDDNANDWASVNGKSFEDHASVFHD
jgi:hypothetical protein